MTWRVACAAHMQVHMIRVDMAVHTVASAVDLVLLALGGGEFATSELVAVYAH
jgi:hypothetical protein